MLLMQDVEDQVNIRYPCWEIDLWEVHPDAAHGRPHEGTGHSEDC